MIQGLALLFLPIGMILVLWLEMFDGLDHGSAVTFVACGLSLFLGIMLYFTRVDEMELRVEHIGRAENLVLFSSLLVFLYLGYITLIYGPSPALLFFMDGSVPPELLYGRYRQVLPLRSVLPPLVIVQTFFALRVLPRRSTVKNFVAKGMTVLSLFAFSMIVDTRHVLLWPMLYFVCEKFSCISSLRRLMNKKRMLYVLLIFIIVWQSFVALGNIRIGSDAVEFGARQLAIDFSLNPMYWDFPGVVIWAIIYLFSGFARGIDRENEIEVFHFDLQEVLFPGFLQFIPSALGLQVSVATDRFSQQAMAIDGYHDLCLVYGFLFGTLLFVIPVFLFIYLVHRINRHCRSTDFVGVGSYVLFLWLGVRILLLPIGSYVFTFGDSMEGMFLYFFMQMVNVHVVEKRDIK